MDRADIKRFDLQSIQPGCWPTDLQELLLKACFSQGENARAALESWKSHTDINRVDEGSNRLLPLLYHNLAAQGIQDPVLAKAKDVYRYVFAKNHLMFHRGFEVLKKLQERNIDTILLKGSALTLSSYKNFGLRPQLDTDFLVRPNRVADTVRCIEDMGWQPEYNFPFETVRLFRHSCGYSAGLEKRLDLHWNVFIGCQDDDLDRIFWDKSIPVEFNHVQTRVFCPTHQLLHNCIHGVRWDTRAPCRWVADTMTIINSKGHPIAWEELIPLARERGMILFLREGMSYLKEKFEADIPDGFLEELKTEKASWRERLEYRVHTHDTSRAFGSLFKYTLDYLRLPRPKGFLAKLIMYPKYLQVSWKLKHLWSMPFQLVAKLFRRRYFE